MQAFAAKTGPFCVFEGAMVRIVEIREDVASMRSNIRNAFIDFSKMTSSGESTHRSAARLPSRLLRTQRGAALCRQSSRW